MKGRSTLKAAAIAGGVVVALGGAWLLSRSSRAVPSERDRGAQVASVASNGRKMTLSSPAFTDASTLPVAYTCDGSSVSPPLVFANVPSEAKSLSLRLTSVPDVELQISRRRSARDRAVHWTLHNLSPRLSGLPEGAASFAPQVMEEQAYAAPCPDGNQVRYRFELIAFDTYVKQPEAGQRVELPEAHVLGRSMLSATYVYELRGNVSLSGAPPQLQDALAYRVCGSVEWDCALARAPSSKDGFALSVPYRAATTAELWLVSPEGRSYGGLLLDLKGPRCRRDREGVHCTVSYASLASGRLNSSGPGGLSSGP